MQASVDIFESQLSCVYFQCAGQYAFSTQAGLANFRLCMQAVPAYSMHNLQLFNTWFRGTNKTTPILEATP